MRVLRRLGDETVFTSQKEPIARDSVEAYCLAIVCLERSHYLRPLRICSPNTVCCKLTSLSEVSVQHGTSAIST